MKGTSAQGAPREGRRTSSEGREDARRLQLIEATVATIAKRGYARTTLAHVTDQARLSRGIANFYFKSKEALLLATLEHLTGEYAASWRKAVADARAEPAERLDALIHNEFSPRVCRRDRVAAWFAFWGEARTRKAYARVCAQTDEQYFRAVVALIEELARETEGGPGAETVASGLCAMMNGFQHDYLIDPDAFDRGVARRACRLYLAALFPTVFGGRLERDEPPRRPARPRARVAETDEAWTLPAWTYDDAPFHTLERERIFRRTWQLAGHVSEVPETGSFASLAVAGERALVIRGEDGAIRAFHNTCRHRAACLAPADRGRCQRAIVCPYHGWTYGFDGALKAVPAEATFPGFERRDHGLVPLEHEVWEGWIFVRFGGDGPSIATMMAPYADFIAPYRMAEMVAERKVVWVDTTDADWKNVMDNFLEGYHLPVGHPGLQRMFGGTYEVQTKDHGAALATSTLRPGPSSAWSERAYQRLLPEVAHLGPERQRAWNYLSLFPNTAFNLYPHNVSFFQVLPLGPGRAMVRGAAFSLPDDRRAMRAARWLGGRINHQVYREDDVLVRSVQAGFGTSVYRRGPLSTKEACVRQFHAEIRKALPVTRQLDRPQGASRVA
jgi:phenylpropionate dioxygenase-like ring-hydroxylating dioxygenase large terminal subunit/AcrR family transcriptional regulator